MTFLSPYGGHTSVTIRISRARVSEVSIGLHRLLGATVDYPHKGRVHLPDDMRAFGLVHGAALKPAWGAFVDMQRRSFAMIRSSRGTLRAVQISSLSTYFGWTDPKGVRVEFHTQDGETYAVSLTYAVVHPRHRGMLSWLLRERQRSYRDETQKLEFIRWLQLEAPDEESWATALTERASHELSGMHVDLEDPPIRAFILATGAAASDAQKATDAAQEVDAADEAGTDSDE